MGVRSARLVNSGFLNSLLLEIRNCLLLNVFLLACVEEVTKEKGKNTLETLFSLTKEIEASFWIILKWFS